jgi:hypothetical protein
VIIAKLPKNAKSTTRQENRSFSLSLFSVLLSLVLLSALNLSISDNCFLLLGFSPWVRGSFLLLFALFLRFGIVIKSDKIGH